MKKVLFKKNIVFLLILVLIFSILSGCKQSQKRTITNIEEVQEIPDKKACQKKAQEKKISEEKQEQKIDKEKEQTKEVKKQKNSIEKQQDIKKEVKNKKENIDVVVIDGVKYENYKGPVQGEIKYKEGIPSTENSKDYKALGDIKSPYKVDLRVTTDFGNKKVFAKNVGMIKDEVGMEILFRNLDIQTAYGGGFVNSINGIESQYTFYTGKDRKKVDWFYWVNGILSPIGIGEYKPDVGDVIWWDYHNWGVTMFIPAVIGSYPQPFKSGFQGKNPGTVIMYDEPYEKEAQELKKSLQNKGVKLVDIAKFDAKLLKNSNKYYILLGVWDDLVKQSDIKNSGGKKENLLEDINNRNKLIGVNVKFENGKLHALNFKGKVITSHERAGTIYAYSSGLGSTKPIWMVTGTDDEGFKMALNILLKNPSKIKDCFGIVVSTDGIEKVPYLD